MTIAALVLAACPKKAYNRQYKNGVRYEDFSLVCNIYFGGEKTGRRACLCSLQSLRRYELVRVRRLEISYRTASVCSARS
jgi:hypothetical protein